MPTGDLRNVDRRMLPEFGRRASAISAGNLAISAHKPQIAGISVNGGRAPMTFNFRSAATFASAVTFASPASSRSAGWERKADVLGSHETAGDEPIPFAAERFG
jgi:hypothetical protein